MLTFLTWFGTALLVAQIITYIKTDHCSPIPWIIGFILCGNYILKAIILITNDAPMAVVLLVVWIILTFVNLYAFRRIVKTQDKINELDEDNKTD